MSSADQSCGGYVAYPVKALKQDYYTVSWWPPSVNTQIAIVAQSDNTNVDVTLPQYSGVKVEYESRMYTSGMTLSATLDATEVLSLKDVAFNDIGGSYISSTKPVAVFSGNSNTSVPVDNMKRTDHIVEQIPPTSAWGIAYPLIAIPDDASVLNIIVVTKEPSTTIRVTDGTNPVHIMRSGDTSRLKTPPNVMLFSDKPVLVAQVVSSSYDMRYTDDEPSMVVIPPVEQYMNSYNFVAPPRVQSNILFIAIQLKYIKGLRLDDNVLPNSEWTTIQGATPELSSTSIRVNDGRHQINHIDSKVKFSVILYGLSLDRCTYAYHIGQCLQDLDQV